MKKQIIKFTLLAGLAGIFVACGGNGSGSYVELKNDGYDQKLFDLSNAEIKKKYPDYDLYHYTSIKAEKEIKNPDEKIKMIKFAIDKDKKGFEYINYVFIKNKKTGDFKVLSATCQSNLKKEIFCNSIYDAPKYYLQ
ncbi:hypothetical protein [Campylobacter lari]|uniref:hypothetical protein n=1 Tax=Campylobacter lari TaxID=201 RepID=UPI000874EE94|nr:hypothetical protein [Campylobacter lari]MCV3399080.1 hypothetical protein [Campylobacter lari]MCV3414606.1 hypothetical protein [Campylobacter lari]MCV3481693.1 hypothetical protein [Campylobacter lari]MCW0242769.1 hypothetical protein [Campylobacter lari]OEV68564.1 hypothetical protein AJY52_07640 [Campylobacter lari]